jgi:hypothetical protein
LEEIEKLLNSISEMPSFVTNKSIQTTFREFVRGAIADQSVENYLLYTEKPYESLYNNVYVLTGNELLQFIRRESKHRDEWFSLENTYCRTRIADIGVVTHSIRSIDNMLKHEVEVRTNDNQTAMKVQIELEPYSYSIYNFVNHLNRQIGKNPYTGSLTVVDVNV